MRHNILAQTPWLGAVVAMGEQYQWSVKGPGVRGPDGRPKTSGIGIGVENGRLILNSNGWASLDAEAIAHLKACIQWADEAAERQRGRT